MRIGKYIIDLTDFEPKFWQRVELEYEGKHEDTGVVYHHRGWLWFVVTYTERFGWDEFQDTIKNSLKE